MKFLHSFLLAAVALLAVGCDSDKPLKLSEIKNATAADSLFYYLVQLRAHDYWEEAEKDTTLRNAKARERYIKGVKAGFDAITDEDKAYNMGVERGMRMAINMHRFENMYDIRIDPDLLVPAFKEGLRDHAEIPELEYQDAFYRIINQLQARQRERDHKKAQTTLIELARSQHLSKISSVLYYKIIKKGEGNYPSFGDTMDVVVNFERADGQDLVVPYTGLATIGAPGSPEVLNNAFLRMNKGSVAMFATTAEEVFGARTSIMGLKPEDTILIYITLNGIVNPGAETSATPTDSIKL
ncbi:MAG: hypothetical protein K2N88_06030 [Muribaculaceae bacterium]|nr:hypothetical protein [Muribaculaceae bacterium]